MNQHVSIVINILFVTGITESRVVSTRRFSEFKRGPFREANKYEQKCKNKQIHFNIIMYTILTTNIIMFFNI